MSAQFNTADMPEEVRRLGEFHRLFEASGQSVQYIMARGLLPAAVAVGMVWAGETWLVPRTWKYYLLVGVAVLMFLNGVRVVIQALRRRRQKIAIFDHGFAIWRNDVLSVFRWDQVELVDSSPAFFGFTIICRTDDEQRKKIHFDTSTDPTQNMRELWREAEERSARARIPAVIEAIDAGEEAVFVRKVWGTIVGTKIGVNQMGINAKSRYGETESLDWPEVAAVAVAYELLNIMEVDEDVPWHSEPLLDVPGYVALVAAANHARAAYVELVAQLKEERLPATLAAVDADQELTFGDIGVSPRGLRTGSEWFDWKSVFEVKGAFDHIAFDSGSKRHRVDYRTLSLADKILAWHAIERGHFRAYLKDVPGGDEHLDEEPDDEADSGVPES